MNCGTIKPETELHEFNCLIRYRIVFVGSGQWHLLKAKTLKAAIHEARSMMKGDDRFCIQDRLKDPDFGWLTVYRPED
jgi:hypothetical protein